MYSSGRPPGTSVRTSLSALFLPSPRAHLSRQLNSASFGLCGSLPLENKRISGLTGLLQPSKRCCHAPVPGRPPPAGRVESSCTRLKRSNLNRLTPSIEPRTLPCQPGFDFLARAVFQTHYFCLYAHNVVVLILAFYKLLQIFF